MFNDKTAKFLLLAALVICVGGAFAPNWIVNQFMFGFSRALAILGLMVLWRTGLVSFGHAFYFGLGRMPLRSSTANWAFLTCFSV